MKNDYAPMSFDEGDDYIDLDCEDALLGQQFTGTFMNETINISAEVWDQLSKKEKDNEASS